MDRRSEDYVFGTDWGLYLEPKLDPDELDVTAAALRHWQDTIATNPDAISAECYRMAGNRDLAIARAGLNNDIIDQFVELRKASYGERRKP